MNIVLKLLSRYFKYILLLSLLYVPIFGQLDSLAFRQYDESRQAINAYEMCDNGNWFVTYFSGVPDMWNTKPPLLIWFQVVCVELLGKNELAIRLPSALAALFTCLLLVYFSNRYLKSVWLGIIAALVLATSWGYVDIHAIRTGDYDSLLTFFSVLAALSFYAYTEKGFPKYLYVFFASIIGAVLTKGIAGVFFIPAFLAYYFWSNRSLELFKNKHFYIGISLFILCVGGFYLTREIQNPGYLNAVYMNELGGRFLEAAENHQADFLYYYLNFRDDKLLYWFLFLPIGACLGFLHKTKRYFKLSAFLTFCILIFFLIISFAKTKLYWYAVPLYPFIALLVAISIYVSFDFLKNTDWFNTTLKFNIVPYIFLFLIFFIPYSNIVKKVAPPIESDKELYSTANFLREAIKGKHSVDGNNVVLVGYPAHIFCYVHVLQEMGVRIRFKRIDEIQIGDTVLMEEANKKQLLDSMFQYSIITMQDYTTQCCITNKKVQ